MKEGNVFYLIETTEIVGFAHLGARGDKADWLEHLYVIPGMRHRGIGSTVIQQLEKIVSGYSQSLYIEVSARNIPALKLYYRNGYDTLNTLTLRKDFHGTFRGVKEEVIGGMTFKIKKDIKE